MNTHAFCKCDFRKSFPVISPAACNTPSSAHCGTSSTRPFRNLTLEDLRVARCHLFKASTQGMHMLPTLLCQKCSNPSRGAIVGVVYHQKFGGISLTSMKLGYKLIPINLRCRIRYCHRQPALFVQALVPQVQQDQVPSLINGSVSVTNTND